MKQLMANEELKNVKTILGLNHEKTYETNESNNTMRYGKVMLMTDQDHDGSHIKGLFINFIHHFWPALLKRGFLQVSELLTQIISLIR